MGDTNQSNISAQLFATTKILEHALRCMTVEQLEDLQRTVSGSTGLLYDKIDGAFPADEATLARQYSDIEKKVGSAISNARPKKR